MRTIYQADDGISFNTELECIAYEKGGKLLAHITGNIGFTYNSDAGFNIIEETDIESYIRTHINKINEIINMQ